MASPHLSVRELQRSDIPHIANYWLSASEEYLHGMGAEKAKLPTREEWTAMLEHQLRTPIEQKPSFCLIWEVDGQPVGHNNVNKIIFGQEAYMHLHMWKPETRRLGYGTELVRLALPVYFYRLQLQRLYCEPSALNPAPNKTLQKLGFELEQEFISVPSPICFEQPVKRWVLPVERLAEVTGAASVAAAAAEG